MQRRTTNNDQQSESKENNFSDQIAAVNTFNIISSIRRFLLSTRTAVPSIFIHPPEISDTIDPNNIRNIECNNTHFILETETINIVNINARLRELYFILESEYKEAPDIVENLYWCALLGAAARLFETLAQSKYDLIDEKFIRGARNIIYHCRGPFSNFEYPELITFFSHCYEHCRVALKPLLMDCCQPLTHSIDLTERAKPYFTSIINYSLNRSGIEYSEVKSLAIARLPRNKKQLTNLIAYLRKHPHCLHNKSDPDSDLKSDILMGSAIGTHIAWIGCDASSLLNGKAANSHTDTTKSPLKKGEAKHIRKEYGIYIKPGNWYRHCETALYPILNKSGIGLCKLDLFMNQIYNYSQASSLSSTSSITAAERSASSAIGYHPQDSSLCSHAYPIPNTTSSASILANPAGEASVSSFRFK